LASAGSVVGATAAVGAWRAFEEWTYECLSDRERERWGTDREVDRDSAFRAAADAYPEVWDTVDREEDVALCVLRTGGRRGTAPVWPSSRPNASGTASVDSGQATG
jgi:tRNA(Ile2)-agmatinylcytidine synthase